MCRSGCRTKDHSNWGDCARAAHISTQRLDGKIDRAFDNETQRYYDAVKDGLDPEAVSHRAIDKAYREVDAVMEFKQLAQEG